MSGIAPTSNRPTRDRPSRRVSNAGWSQHGLKLAFALASFAAVMLVLGPVISGERQQVIDALRQAALPGSLLVLVLLVAVRHQRHWSEPTNRLKELVGEIRRGEAAADELADLQDAPPQLLMLAAQIGGLCRELKAQKQVVRELESQIQQRVATRTTSLEQKLGALREKAARDALTGLNNRGAFDHVFPAMVERARREAVDLCVVMIDVDHFKALNDTLGHAAGDDLLRKIGQLIRGAVREQDEAFRYGGDEFVLVLWNTSTSAGRATGARVSRLVEDLTRSMPLAHPPRLSCGVANLTGMSQAGAAALLRAADEDLYRVKHSRTYARAA